MRFFLWAQNRAILSVTYASGFRSGELRALKPVDLDSKRGLVIIRQAKGKKDRVETIIAIPDISSASMAPDPAYNVSEFRYSKRAHTYTCPQGQKLTTNGRWYRKERSGAKGRKGDSVMVQHFKTKACKTCPALALCTKNTTGRGRVIERTEHQNYIDQNRKNVQAKELLYKRRQAIVEHPFGVIKRQWGFYYEPIRKGMDRATADLGLISTSYSLRRVI